MSPGIALLLLPFLIGDSADHPQRYRHFGRVLAAVGDVDGDGSPDFAIADPLQVRDPVRGVWGLDLLVGRVWIVRGRDGSVIHALAAPEKLDGFGASVAGVGDLDRDGRADFAVGAPDLLRPGTGRVYVFSGRSKQVLWSATGSVRGAGFGSSVAGLGDVDGDGVGDIAVAREREGEGEPGSAHAFVLSGADGRLLLAIASPDEYARFSAVSAAGDLDRDGRADVLLTTHLAGGKRAVATICSGADGAVLWTQERHAERGVHLVARGGFDTSGDGVPDVAWGVMGDLEILSGEDGALLRRFEGGCQGAIEVLPDLDADGAPELMATNEAWGINQGIAQVWSPGRDETLTTYEGHPSCWHFGVAAAVIGDLDGDSWPEVAIGEDNRFSGGTNRVHVVSLGKGECLYELAREGDEIVRDER